VTAVERLGLEDLVVVTPDIGSVKVARLFARDLHADFAIIDKRRHSSFDVDVATVIGDVKGKDVLLADDMCSTGGTLVSAAKACHERGARRIVAAVTHGLFVGEAVRAITASPIERVLMSNTIPHTNRLEGFERLEIVSVASLFSQAIDCILSAGSISSMYCPTCE
jgi:ribose-phosphate pyrophosphokinase